MGYTVAHRVDVAGFIHCMHSPTRRRILAMLCETELTATEVFERLTVNEVIYRQSVHRSLQILTENGLICKFYSNEKKCICYRINRKRVAIDLATMEIR